MLAHWLQATQKWIVATIETFEYFGLFALLFIETIFPPIPSEVILPFTGFLISSNSLSLTGALLASTAGAVSGSLFHYYLGTLFSKQALIGWFETYGKWLLLSQEEIKNAFKKFENNGSWYVFVGRCIPGVRSLISLPAGVSKMKATTFLLFTTLGSLLWNSLLIAAGLLLERNWTQVLSYVSIYENAIWLLLGLGILIKLFRRNSRFKQE